MRKSFNSWILKEISILMRLVSMAGIAAIFKFSWPYLRTYWMRLTLGLLLAVGFGLSNATFV